MTGFASTYLPAFDQIGDGLYFAGRLANYIYIDMDDGMPQAIDTAADVLANLRRRPAAAD
jgi:UDP-galactopyranose mutase